MQLVAGRVGQEYNRRKGRRGAFWEDRYHATAVADDHHFMECLVYIDLNMVRIGAVNDPADWPMCGLHENRHLRQRFRLIDEETLLALAGVQSMAELEEVRTHMAREKNRSGYKYPGSAMVAGCRSRGPGFCGGAAKPVDEAS